MRSFISFIALMLCAMPVFASGFGLYAPGAQGKGNAGAFTARAEDASAIFYNPAGLAQLGVSEILFSADTLFSRSFASDAGQTTRDSETATTVYPELFANWRWGKLALGLGSASTLGYEVNWDDPEFPSRFSATGTEIEAREWMASLAGKLSERFSMGVTLRNVDVDYAYTRNLPRPIPSDPSLNYESRESFDVSGSDFGFSVGFQYYAGRRFSVGLTYFSPVEIDLDGDRSYSLLTRTEDQRAIDAFSTNFSDGPISSMIELPERIAIGVASRVTVRARLEIDVSRDGWSSIEETVFQGADSSDRTVIPRRWDDVYFLRVAGDFQQRRVILWRLGLASSIGSVVPDDTVEPGFVDNDRFIYSFGVSYTYRRKWIFEGAWLYTQNRDREVEDMELVYDPSGPPWTQATGQDLLFETQRHELHFGLRYRFGVQ